MTPLRVIGFQGEHRTVCGAIECARLDTIYGDQPHEKMSHSHLLTVDFKGIIEGIQLPIHQNTFRTCISTTGCDITSANKIAMLGSAQHSTQ